MTKNHSRKDADRWQEKRIPALFDGTGDGERHRLERVKGAGDDTTFNRALPLRGADRVTSPFEQVPIVHAAVSEFAECVAGLQLKLWRSDPREDEDAQEVTGHPLLELLARPNKWMTWSRFAYAGAVHRKTSGEDLWFLQDSDGMPLRVDRDGVIRLSELKAIWPVSGARAQLEYDGLGQPMSWRYSQQRSGTYQEASYWSVVGFKDYNPELPFRGLGAVEVVRGDIELEWQALRYQDALLRNGGDPGGFLLFDGTAPTRDEQEQAQQDAETSFGQSSAGKVRVAWGSSPKYTPNPISPKDLEYPELFRLVRQRVASSIGVPLESIGFHENATYNNITEAHREKWRKVVSYVVAVEEVINSDFLSRLDDRQARGFVARFDLSKVKALQEDQGVHVERAKALALDTGISFNEALLLLGVETKPTDGGDIALASAGTRLMDDVLNPPEPAPMPAAPAAGDDDEEQSPSESGDGDPEDAVADEARGAQAKSGAPLIQLEDPEAAQARAYQSRRDYFKTHEDRVLEPGERKFKRAAEDVLGRYQKAAIARLTDYAANGSKALGLEGGVLARDLADDLEIAANSISQGILGPVLPDAEEWTAKFWAAFDGPTEETFEEAVRFLAFEMGTPSIPMDGGFVQEILAEQKRILSVRVHENLEKSLANSIARVFKGDETVSTLQQHIRRQLAPLKTEVRNAVAAETRANRIARTETGKASNSGRHEQMRASGTQEIEWVSAADDVVRAEPEANHRALDGTRSPIGEEFRDSTGNAIPNLTHPHAPGAPAAQVVNCRCTTRPIPVEITPDAF